MDKPKKKVMSDMVARPKSGARKPAEAVSKPVRKEPVREPLRSEKIPVRKIPEPIRYEELSEEEEIFDEEENVPEDDYQDEKSLDELIHHYGDKPKSKFGCVIWFVALLAIVALVVAIGGQFTHADISITPKSYSGAVDATLALSQARIANGIQVGIATKDFQSETVIPATGRSESDIKATAAVRLYNSTTTSKTVPVGTILVSSKSVQYETAKSVTIPKAKSASVFGQADVAITAVAAGESGNGDLDDFTFAKSSTLFKGITIHSVTPAIGGTVGDQATADPTTLAAAKDVVMSNLSDQASLVARLSQDLPDDAIALPLVIPLADATVDVDGTKPDGVHVVAHRSVSTLIVNRSALALALGKNLSVPDGINLTLPSFDGLTVTSSDVAQGQAVPSIVHIRITGTVTIAGSVKASDVASSILGKSRSQARATLTALPEIKSFILRVTPPWRRLLPTDPSEISVSIKN
ncbi:MAG: hypothetical protein JWM20_132 [Patescibacteria group bacterium]|nr:hypothetical protein [Patescibacteria group bacterium]